MKRLFIVATALALCSCSALGPAGVNTPPALLQNTVIDKQSLIAAWSAFDVALTTLDVLVATKKLTPGSVRAKTITGHLETAQTALNAATAAQRAGNATSYATAVAQANRARRLASALLQGN